MADKGEFPKPPEAKKGPGLFKKTMAALGFGATAALIGNPAPASAETPLPPAPKIDTAPSVPLAPGEAITSDGTRIGIPPSSGSDAGSVEQPLQLAPGRDGVPGTFANVQTDENQGASVSVEQPGSLTPETPEPLQVVVPIKSPANMAISPFPDPEEPGPEKPALPLTPAGGSQLPDKTVA